MKTRKKLLLLCLVGMMGLGTNAQKTYHNYSFVENGIYYKTTENGKAVVTFYDYDNSGNYNIEQKYSGIISIPNSIRGYTVIGIGNHAFSNCSGLTSVTIPESVTSISESAFYGCRGLTSVTIPNSVTSIGNSAFFGCWGINYITIPESVTSIGEKAFYKTDLKSVTIGSGVLSIGDDAFTNDYGDRPVKVIWFANTFPKGYENAAGVRNYVPNELYELKNQIVYPFLSSIFEVEGAKYVPVSPSERTCDVIDCTYNEAAKKIHIGKTVSYRGIDMTVRQVNDYAFTSNNYIEDVKIEHGGNIGYGAFNNCDNIKSVIICNNGNIGECAFHSCDGIQTATISNNGNIGAKAFRYSKGLQTATISSNGNIGDEAFYMCNIIEKLTISNKGSIGKKAFSDSYFIGKLEVHNTGGIYENAFSNISDSFNAIVNNNVGNNVFFGSSGLKTISIGERASIIGDKAFMGCSQLQSIIILDSVKSLGSSAFSGCSNIQSVKIGNGVPAINQNTFKDCSSLADLQIGENVKSIGLEAFSGCKMLPVIRIPQSVTQIDNNAFSGCTSLKQVIMEEKKGDYSKDVLTLGSNGSNPLFASCPLDSVFIGRNISYSTSSNYGYSPFYRNASLRSVVITDRETEISPNEFYGCTNLKNVKIGDGVTTIGDWAFSGCSSLKSFAFGLSVKSIGKEAFSDCTAITSIRSRAVVPPVCGSHALDDLNKWDCTLYVPVGYVNAYMAANQWKEFFFVQEGDLVTFPVTSISLNKECVTLKVNETEMLVATLLPENATDKSVKWTSSDEAIATVDANGVVTAKKVGKAIIIAVSVSNPDVTAACEVIVSQPVQSVTLNETSIFFDEIGATYQLTATVLPEDAENKSVTWASSNSAVCTISEEGLVTAIGDGTATVTVTTVDGGKTATCEVAVFIPVTAIVISYQTLQLQVGDKKKLGINVRPNNATDQSVEWSSSDNLVVTVDAEGNVTAKKAGTVVITVTSVSNPEISASCEVTVTQPVKSISLNEGKIAINGLGETYQLIATVLPEDASDKSVTWTSSHDSICTVSQTGLVTAVGPGLATIVVTSVDSGKYATCQVSVNIPVQSITLNPDTLLMQVGDSRQLEVTILPDNATDTRIEWISSEESVATVDVNGNVTAKKGGTSVITVASASNPDVSASCEVIVIQSVTSVSLNKSRITINGLGEKYQLKATVHPDDASNKSVVWTSSDEGVCIVSEFGLVTAVEAGMATITVVTVDGGKTATCEVIVKIPVQSITFNADTLLMQVGDSRQLEATILPDKATDTRIEWTSSDKTVAIVDFYGMVTALKEGKAFITVKSVAYPDVMAVCDVTVIEDNGIMMLEVGEMLYVRAIYDVTGRKLERLQQGINVLLLKDGTIRKINLKN